MESVIVNELRKIEDKDEIQILFAVESGSRLWGMSSGNSDYDIRFVYARPVHSYLTIMDKQKETIDELKGEFDFSGWDVKKYLSLLSKSNPSAIEWLVADQIYLGAEVLDDLQFLLRFVNYRSLYEHYRSMAYTNFSRYIEPKLNPRLKKYLYVFRGIVNALFVLKNKRVPPSNFVKLVSTSSLIPEDISQELQKLIDMKVSGHEMIEGQRIIVLDNFVNKFLSNLLDHRRIFGTIKEGKQKTDFDRLFQKLIGFES